MDNLQIDMLLKQKDSPFDNNNAECVSTHISWVLLFNDYVLKIKKPIRYPFLDFSTLEKRKHFCDREVVLNNRFTNGVYLKVLPIIIENGTPKLVTEYQKHGNNITDYGVLMKKIEPSTRMDLMLLRNEVTPIHLQQIADQLITFHKRALQIHNDFHLTLPDRFNELLAIDPDNDLGLQSSIFQAVEQSNNYLKNNTRLLIQREKQGFIRDVHGDLHSRNIFLLTEPIIFDCIEFNDDFRQIDLLDELAFLCMDLEAFGRADYSDHLFNYYNSINKICKNEDEKHIFTYYKAYRANIRAKVNMLRAMDSKNIFKENYKKEAKRYLKLMHVYLAHIGRIVISS